MTRRRDRLIGSGKKQKEKKRNGSIDEDERPSSAGGRWKQWNTVKERLRDKKRGDTDCERL